MARTDEATVDRDAGNEQPTILFIARDAEQRYDLRSLLEAEKYEVYCRDARIRAFQLMTVYLIDLVVVDIDLTDGSGLDFCRDFRADANFANIPVVVIGEDNEEAATCIAAFEAGADDFVQAPFVPAVCLHRIKRLLHRRLKTRNQVKNSLSVQVTSGELPGIVQYLEAEVKSGKLTVKSHKGTAVIYITQGRFANATAPHCEGVHALTEALSWEESQVTFEEVDLKPEEVKEEQPLTSVLMNCVVDVDEFREARDSLPPADAMFVPGEKKPDKEMDRHQRDLWEQAINGWSVDELLYDQPYGERRATLFFKGLIDEGYLSVAEPAFHDYTATTFKHYKRLLYKQRLVNIRASIAEVEFPLAKEQGNWPIAPANWISPAAKVVVTGDRPDHVDMFVDSLCRIYSHLTKLTPPEHKGLPGTSTRRLDFGDKNVLDVQKLPPILEKRFLTSLDDYLGEAVAVVMIATDQTRRANQMNLRLIRQIRQRFKGVYYNVVPRVPDKEGRALFKLDCHNCGYRLAVELEEAGNQGECPICNADVLIPDALDHLATSLQLPHDVPVVLVEPNNPLHVRDLLMLVIDTILHAADPPPEALSPTAQSAATGESGTEPAAADAALARQSTVRQKRRRPPEEPEAPQAEPEPAAASEPASELEDILSMALTADPDPAPEPTDFSAAIESILGDESEDDFDIDDFIKKVRRD